MNDKKFTELLSAIIASHGMTPEGLAASMSIPTEEMISYVSGEKQPDYKTTSDIVHALGMTMDDFNRMYNREEIPLREREASPEMKEFFDRRLSKGKRIVKAIIAVELISSTLSFLLNLTLGNLSGIITLTFTVFLMYKLYHGKKWARIVYLVFATLAIVSNLFSILAGAIGFAALLITAVQFIIAAALIANNDVAEFLEEQRKYY